MKASSRFQEVQSFRQPWVLALMFVPVLLFLWGIIQQIILGQAFGSSPMSDGALIAAFVGFILFFLWFVFLLQLVVEVDETGIHYKFRGIHFKKYHIGWSEIETAEAIKYKPLREYGGWGIRYGFHGKAYSVSGDEGVQVQTVTGARILFGSLRSTEFMATIRLYFKNKS